MGNLSIPNLFYLLGIIQALFFSLLFFLKRKRFLSDVVAGLWLMFFALEFSMVIWVDLKGDKATLISNIELLFTLLHGPFLYFYIKKLLLKQGSFRFQEGLHLLPFLSGLFFVMLNNGKNSIFLIPFAGIISGLTYIVYSISVILKLKSYPHLKIDTTKNIAWLLNLCFGLLVVWILPLMIVNILRIQQQDINSGLFYLLVPVFIFYLSFKGINQQLIYIHPAQKDISTIGYAFNKQEQNAGSYANSTLQKEEMKNIYNLLNNCMTETKLFLNPELSLKILSENLKLPQHHITQTLSVYSNQNFSDFVNQYRVNEFKFRILKSGNNNYSLMGIASECGFNSKSTFNRVFKKITGLTPSEYITELSS